MTVARLQSRMRPDSKVDPDGRTTAAAQARVASGSEVPTRAYQEVPHMPSPQAKAARVATRAAFSTPLTWLFDIPHDGGRPITIDAVQACAKGVGCGADGLAEASRSDVGRAVHEVDSDSSEQDWRVVTADRNGVNDGRRLVRFRRATLPGQSGDRHLSTRCPSSETQPTGTSGERHSSAYGCGWRPRRRAEAAAPCGPAPGRPAGLPLPAAQTPATALVGPPAGPSGRSSPRPSVRRGAGPGRRARGAPAASSPPGQHRGGRAG